MTYRNIRRAEVRQDVDRRTWADLERAGFDVQVKGYGEYLTVNPIMFGQAFEAPPFFTFSVTGTMAGGGEVKAIGWPTDFEPKVYTPMGDWTGIGSQLQREGWLPDGSFEHQAEVWGDPYIPSIGEWDISYDIFDSQGWQKIGVASYDELPFAGTSNWWIQIGPPANTGPRWECSDEQAYPNEPGYKGRWSAMYEFDAEPISPWLVPVNVAAFNPVWSEDFWTDEMTETNIYTMTHDCNYENSVYPDGGYMPIAMNPPLNKTTFTAHVYSDGPCEFEFYRRDWGWWGGEDPTYSLDLGLDGLVIAIAPNVWSEARFVSPINPAQWPNYPLIIADQDELFFRTIKLRVKGGSPGQKVYIDNCWLWPDLTTRGAPLLTIGVAEWIRDDRGMYLGAHLWFKTGTEVNTGTEV